MIINLSIVENLRRNIRSVRKDRNLAPLPMNIAATHALPVKFKTTAVLVLLNELLHSNQFKRDSFSLNLKIGTQIVFQKKANSSSSNHKPK